MKKQILTLALLTPMMVSAEFRFSYPVPQPDSITPYEENGDSDGSLGFGQGSGSQTPPVDYTDEYIVTSGVMWAGGVGFHSTYNGGAGSITNNQLDGAEITEIYMTTSSTYCSINYSLRNGDFTAPFGIEINGNQFSTNELSQFNLATYNSYNSHGMRSSDMTLCNEIATAPTWNIKFMRGIQSKTETLGSVDLKVVIPEQRYIGTTDSGYGIYGYLASTYQEINGDGYYGINDFLENGATPVITGSLAGDMEFQFLGRVQQGSGYGSRLLFTCNPSIDGSFGVTSYVKDSDGNIVAEYTTPSWGDISNVNTSHQSAGNDYCDLKGVSNTIFRPNYAGVETGFAFYPAE